MVNSRRENNHISSRGYNNFSIEYLEQYGIKQYVSQSFGVLEKVNNNRELIISNKEALFSFYSPIISSATTDVLAITDIKSRGFKRCAANKVNFAALATSPEEYIERVKYIIAGYLSKRTIDAVFSAIAILEKGDFNNPSEFITAAVVTGYVYNFKPILIEHMQPIDD